MMRLAGLTDGPPISIRLSVSAGPVVARLGAAGEDAAQQGVGEGDLHGVPEEAHLRVGGDAARAGEDLQRDLVVRAAG